MKQQFTEVSEVMVTREYDIPDEDILQYFDTIKHFTDTLKSLESEELEFDDLTQDHQEFIGELNCNYDADEVGEPYWVGSAKGNVETNWKFKED